MGDLACVLWKEVVSAQVPLLIILDVQKIGQYLSYSIMYTLSLIRSDAYELDSVARRGPASVACRRSNIIRGTSN
eukprot:5109363-Pyramimonas_sp.AAC.1